ncbi:hypothetical protein [Croceibacterium xixiisoli]|uniref:hypothetical protein n=1 Tax=Croceibacterium xixiisoli TaxID=1476466 RepID=UPI00136F3613|nr:hypothetical protein [Croceibacterium xixiisoli]
MIFALAGLAACGSSEESTTIGGTTFAQGSDGAATISNENGSLSATDGAAAANTQFPDYAPKYPGATVESALVSNTDEGKRTMAVLVTDDSMESVVAFYREKFTAGGMEVGMVHSSADSGMISAEGNGRKVSATGGVQDGKTSFTLSFSGE